MRDLPTWAKLVIALVLFVLVVVVLFTSVFPQIEARLISDPVLRG